MYERTAMKVTMDLAASSKDVFNGDKYDARNQQLFAATTRYDFFEFIRSYARITVAICN